MIHARATENFGIVIRYHLNHHYPYTLYRIIK